MRLTPPLILLLALAGGACAADMPDDAQRAIATFEKAVSDNDAKLAAEVVKNAEALTADLRKLMEKETKAHHSDNVRKLGDYLEDPAKKSTADLPEAAAVVIAENESKKAAMEAKAQNETLKQKSVLAKALQKAIDRQTKAGDAEGAALAKQYLDAHVDKNVTAALAATAPGKNPDWPDFIASINLISDAKGAAASISIGDWTMKAPGKGMNVVAMVDGKRVIESAFGTAAQYLTLAEEIDKLPQGAYVVIAIKQGTMVGTAFPPKTQKALRACGAKQGLDGQPAGSSYVLIGAKGMNSSQAIEKVQVDRIVYPFPGKKAK
jgi:hypothetical protein